jgi:hypothetical protein
VIRYPFSDRLKVALRLCLKLDVASKRLDPRVLERKLLRSNVTDKLDRTNAMCLFRES